ncbi:hypothetical protein ANN_06722 [Periplaneta americana]|uniref:Uncharacterized protein n=1 Tax=Periplaneta americana TaxID=6978 RepID=A0ABQ8TF66_PERAM|nr:hypothetical protein ANN_06722 [Periplaneta americana]
MTLLFVATGRVSHAGQAKDENPDKEATQKRIPNGSEGGRGLRIPTADEAEEAIHGFPQRWIGRGRPILPAPLDWQPRSPDLTTYDNARESGSRRRNNAMPSNRGKPTMEIYRPPSKILRKRLRFHPYRLQLLQALKPEDKVLRRNFCISMQILIENNDEFIHPVVLSDDATFHLSGKVNRYNLRIWVSENPRTYVELDYRLDVCRVTKGGQIEHH